MRGPEEKQSPMFAVVSRSPIASEDHPLQQIKGRAVGGRCEPRNFGPAGLPGWACAQVDEALLELELASVHDG